MTINELIAQQQALVESLKKRITGIDAMIQQGNQERNELVYDILRAQGKLDGLQAAAAIPAEKVELPSSGIMGEKA